MINGIFERFRFLIIGILTITITIISFCCDPDDDDKVAYKPNIYIYPQETINLDVYLEFPSGGKVISSIPEYTDGWKVTVDTNGIIDNQYSYLFYESIQPDIWQNKSGWIVKTSELEMFFNENMRKYGFYGQEIKDFIEYWIPRLNKNEFYIIYPQTSALIDRVVDLNFSVNPDNVLRLYYVIKGSNNPTKQELNEPKITSFPRNGFFVTEWGVIL